MNRTIKFRIWNNKTNSWIHGPNKNPSLDGVNLFGEMIMFGELLHGVSIKDHNECVAVQFTGMKDINGIELFEGDICSFDSEENGPREKFINEPISFEWGSFRINGYPIENYVENEYAGANDICSLIRVGNIFENKEFIKL